MLLFTALPPRWTRTDENIARLLDLAHYWLAAEYASWTVTPAEAKAAEQQRKKQKRPPPVPLIEPVAERPPEVAAAARERYYALLEHYGVGDNTPPTPTERPTTGQSSRMADFFAAMNFDDENIQGGE